MIIDLISLMLPVAREYVQILSLAEDLQISYQEILRCVSVSSILLVLLHR
jgi:hypothetical protein